MAVLQAIASFFFSLFPYFKTKQDQEAGKAMREVEAMELREERREDARAIDSAIDNIVRVSLREKNRD